MNAYKDLLEFIGTKDEKIEGIIFGKWGWGGYNEPKPTFVPLKKRNILLTIDEAKPMMEGWSFYGGYGAPECYAVYVWTDKRVIWVTEYDGSTTLDSAPRNPQNVIPYMPGG